MAWTVEMTAAFEEWFRSLDDAQQDSLAVNIGLLSEVGPALGRPHADSVKGSRHSNIKELRTQHEGRPLRTFFAFDPRRVAILLIGGDKTGDKRFYDRMIRLADKLYSQHLATLKRGE